jgi:NAD(P)-dependent dehydrogenase (short-subunit alcohol dehydrogenase family)
MAATQTKWKRKFSRKPKPVSASTKTERSKSANRSRHQMTTPMTKRTAARLAAYSQSKLACLMFALEFERRSHAAGWGVSSLAAHPGLARTEIIANGPGTKSAFGTVGALAGFLFQAAAQGALPTLYAATAREAVGGAYYGPDRMGGTQGHPGPARIPARAGDEAIAARLWVLSEQLTGVSF